MTTNILPPIPLDGTPWDFIPGAMGIYVTILTLYGAFFWLSTVDNQKNTRNVLLVMICIQTRDGRCYRAMTDLWYPSGSNLRQAWTVHMSDRDEAAWVMLNGVRTYVLYENHISMSFNLDRHSTMAQEYLRVYTLFSFRYPDNTSSNLYTFNIMRYPIRIDLLISEFYIYVYLDPVLFQVPARVI